METQLLQMQTVEALQIAVKGRIVWKGNIKSLSEGSLIYVPFSIHWPKEEIGWAGFMVYHATFNNISVR